MFSITYQQCRALILMAACVVPITEITLNEFNVGSKTLGSLKKGGLINDFWEDDTKGGYRVWKITPWGDVVAEHCKAIIDAGVMYFGAGGYSIYAQKYFKQDTEKA